MKTERNVKFISTLQRCILNSPSGKLVKTERNVKFISNIAEVHPKFAVRQISENRAQCEIYFDIAEVHPKFAARQISENRAQCEIYFDIAEKGADGIRLRLRYHIHGRLLLVREEFLGLISLDKKLSEDVSSGLR